ncbi:Putative tyrosyl-DNA phosphodiesterase I [Colletotrichum destructivum]|uniref:Tyrosyl-DNA phosphodiesterase I n=1 Tax=Colletotrichum destructivum TaxID=34406 RepID=A0AAX4IJ31_9PEZI|nr:Putative tyrosyl-DNA phosphodiesterase I [Colletotrichum destructivum]
MDRPPKRQRLSGDVKESKTGNRHPGPQSLSRAISPPKKRNRHGDRIASPFQLTRIRDLPEAANKDTVTLKDILGDPLIAECWEFNFLHDIHFLMSHFDEDTRNLVKVHVIHGFWKKEDPNRLALQEDAEAYPNVELHGAFMPEMFGTHHSKMMVLIRHDDSAQVIIHTANMIVRDWTNMTNAVWRSPLLPLLSDDHAEDASATDHPFGTGKRFKHDLLSYLRAYNARRPITRTLVTHLCNYDFSSVRATFIASVPGRHPIHDTSQTAWGWPALKRALGSVPVQEGESEIVVQVSSIATLGPTDSWIQKCLFDSLAASKNKPSSRPKPKFKVVFPTADEIRRSLDGYASGGSIHTKIQSQQQMKQLQYLRPIFCHWANDAPEGKMLSETAAIQKAGRERAAPHIKTYIRYGEKSIDWALVTSANISKQAWGEATGASQEVRIASWEVGVLVWPSIITDNATMVGTFETDMPPREGGSGDTVVGLRIPYDLPLQSYGKDEIPWVASMAHTEPDRMGRFWGAE